MLILLLLSVFTLGNNPTKGNTYIVDPLEIETECNSSNKVFYKIYHKEDTIKIPVKHNCLPSIYKDLK